MYNFEDMTILKFLQILLEMPIHVPKILVLGVEIGEGIFGFRPQPNQFFRFRPKRFLPNFVKIG